MLDGNGPSAAQHSSVLSSSAKHNTKKRSCRHAVFGPRNSRSVGRKETFGICGVGWKRCLLCRSCGPYLLSTAKTPVTFVGVDAEVGIPRLGKGLPPAPPVPPHPEDFGSLILPTSSRRKELEGEKKRTNQLYFR